MAKLKNWVRAFGLNPRVTLAASRGLLRYWQDRANFRRASQMARSDIPLKDNYPVLHEYFGSAGQASGHYFHMDLWAARRIYERAPLRHVDIGSRIDGFVGHLLTFRSVEVVDIRPLISNVTGLQFTQTNATTLDSYGSNSLVSISCLHAAEHFGLGRYGDPIDPLAYRKLIQALCRVLAPGGWLYFAVPIGVERVEFNAHRVFDPMRIAREFGALELRHFSAVTDDGDFVSQAVPGDYRHSKMACGLYEFTKTNNS